MIKKTLGGSSTKPKNTRDYSAKPQCENGKSKCCGADSYHVDGRPSTRGANEQDR